MVRYRVFWMSISAILLVSKSSDPLGIFGVLIRSLARCQGEECIDLSDEYLIPPEIPTRVRRSYGVFRQFSYQDGIVTYEIVKPMGWVRSAFSGLEDPHHVLL